MGYWSVEILGVNPDTAAALLYRFALGQGQAPTDEAHIRGDLERWASPSQKIDVDRTGLIRTGGEGGEIVISNKPDNSASVGFYDALTRYAWQDRVGSLYWIEGGNPDASTWASKTLVAQGLLEQPVATMGTLRFPLKDPRAALDAPLQTTLYLGDNVLPDGVEGGEDLKGKPKPIIYGSVSNITPDIVNTSKLIYCLADKEVTVACVRDGGAPLAPDTLRANIASLEANAPPAGSYDYVYDPTGTYIRLGSMPVYGITFDADEDNTEADRTHAQVWARIRLERCGTDIGDIDAASVTEVDGLDANGVGFYFANGETRREALDKVLASLLGYEVQDLDGNWIIGRLEAPSGNPALNLVSGIGSTTQADTDRPILKDALQRTRPGWEPNGSPPFRVNVRWGFNHTIMRLTDFAGSASLRLKAKFAKAWRVETANNPAIWEPVAETGHFPNAPELTIDTGYQPGADGLTCPHAATRSWEILALFSGLKGQYVVRFLPEVGDSILPGSVVQVTHPRFSMHAGPLFRVLQSSWVVQAGRDAEAQLVIGLQTDVPIPGNIIFLSGFEGLDGSQSVTDESLYAHTVVMSGSGGGSGDGVIDTSTPKFGVSSIYFPGTLHDRAQMTVGAEARLDGRAFTMKGWVRWEDLDAPFDDVQGLWGVRQDTASPLFGILKNDTHNLLFRMRNGLGSYDLVDCASTGLVLAPGAWYFIEANRDVDSNMRLFLNGAMVAKTTFTGTDSVLLPGAILEIGRLPIEGLTRNFQGWMDEVCFIVGSADHPSDASYSVPVAPFTRP